MYRMCVLVERDGSSFSLFQYTLHGRSAMTGRVNVNLAYSSNTLQFFFVFISVHAGSVFFYRCTNFVSHKAVIMHSN